MVWLQNECEKDIGVKELSKGINDFLKDLRRKSTRSLAKCVVHYSKILTNKLKISVAII